MKQSHNSRGADYDIPPPILYSLVKGRTWELYCGTCERFIVVDVIKLLEHYDPYDRVSFEKTKCRECGGKLKQTGGLVISGLRYIGKWPVGQTLVVAGGGPWGGSSSTPFG